MIFYGNQQVNDIYYGNLKLKKVFNDGNQIWKPTFEADEEAQFVPDEHHPVDPLFTDYYSWSIYLRTDAHTGDKVKFPYPGTDPIYVGPGAEGYPMVVYDFYNQDWEEHTDFNDDTYRLGKDQTVEYGETISQYDIEILNPNGSLFPVSPKIEGVGNGAWSISYRNGAWSDGNQLLTELYIGDYAADWGYSGGFKLGHHAFYNSPNLKNIRLPEPLELINQYCFAGCPSLRTADLRNCSNLKNIEKEAFANCTSLEKIILPRPERISNSMLDGCSSLQKVVLLAEEPPIMYNDISDEVGLTRFVNVPYNIEICVNPASVQKYKAAPRWSYYQIRSYIADDFDWAYVQ